MVGDDFGQRRVQRRLCQKVCAHGDDDNRLAAFNETSVAQIVDKPQAFWFLLAEGKYLFKLVHQDKAARLFPFLLVGEMLGQAESTCTCKEFSAPNRLFWSSVTGSTEIFSAAR